MHGTYTRDHRWTDGEWLRWAVNVPLSYGGQETEGWLQRWQARLKEQQAALESLDPWKAQLEQEIASLDSTKAITTRSVCTAQRPVCWL